MPYVLGDSLFSTFFQPDRLQNVGHGNNHNQWFFCRNENQQINVGRVWEARCIEKLIGSRQMYDDNKSRIFPWISKKFHYHSFESLCEGKIRRKSRKIINCLDRIRFPPHRITESTC